MNRVFKKFIIKVKDYIVDRQMVVVKIIVFCCIYWLEKVLFFSILYYEIFFNVVFFFCLYLGFLKVKILSVVKLFCIFFNIICFLCNCMEFILYGFRLNFFSFCFYVRQSYRLVYVFKFDSNIVLLLGEDVCFGFWEYVSYIVLFYLFFLFGVEVIDFFKVKLIFF